MSEPIFVLGDSRTGTTTLHNYFERLGIRSVHYFVDEAGVTEPFHRHRQEKWLSLKAFIDTSGFRAFSDYPTRLFFRELVAAYPSAHFILSARATLETWQNSYRRYFGLGEEDLAYKSGFYSVWNEEIRWLCADAGVAFLELCIDDDATQNAQRLCEFLGVDFEGGLPWANRS